MFSGFSVHSSGPSQLPTAPGMCSMFRRRTDRGGALVCWVAGKQAGRAQSYMWGTRQQLCPEEAGRCRCVVMRERESTPRRLKKSGGWIVSDACGPHGTLAPDPSPALFLSATFSQAGVIFRAGLSHPTRLGSTHAPQAYGGG